MNEKKYINKNCISEILLTDKQKINYSLKFMKDTWKKRPIPFLRKGEKWDADYYIIHHYIYSGYIYTKDEIAKKERLMFIDDVLYEKPYLKIIMNNKDYECIYFTDFGEMEDYVKSLNIDSLIIINK